MGSATPRRCQAEMWRPSASRRLSEAVARLDVRSEILTHGTRSSISQPH